MKLFAKIFFAILTAAAVIAAVIGIFAWRASETRGWIAAADANHSYLTAITESCLREATLDRVKEFNRAMEANREIITKNGLPARDAEFYDKQALQIYDQMKEVLRLRAPSLISELRDPKKPIKAAQKPAQ